MGKKGRWFGVVKRVFGPESKEKNSQISEKGQRSRKGWFGKYSDENLSGVHDTAPNKLSPERGKFGNAESDECKHAYSVALASAVAAEAAAVAAKAAAEVVRLTKTARFPSKSMEETAAIKIQTAFRGHLARRALRALRGLVRLKELTKSNSVKHQTAATLQCMQTLARVQSQIRSRRIRMTEENQALQKQLQLKHERELEKQKISDEWDTSLQTKEQLEANLHNKQEAALRRERAMAYAFSHQWRNSSKANPMVMDPNNPQWGWSWLERWMAARPWESRNAAERDLNLDNASMRSLSRSATGSDLAKTNARRDTNLDRTSPVQKSRPTTRHSISLPPSKVASVTRKAKPASPKGGAEDETGSPVSTQSERLRRNSSVAGSSARDDVNLASTSATPSHMSSSRLVKPKSRLRTFSVDMSDNALERGSVSSAKKRLSYPATTTSSPTAARRHSGPPKVDVASFKNNGGGR